MSLTADCFSNFDQLCEITDLDPVQAVERSWECCDS